MRTTRAEKTIIKVRVIKLLQKGGRYKSSEIAKEFDVGTMLIGGTMRRLNSMGCVKKIQSKCRKSAKWAFVRLPNNWESIRDVDET